MEIRQITTETVWIKGKRENILVDPVGEMIAGDKVGGRVVLLTKKNDKLGLLSDEKRIIINGPGEYEIGGVEVTGINSGNGDTSYLLVIDGVTVGIMGILTEGLSDKRIDRLESMDVMIYKIGGAIVAKTAMELAKKWGVNYLLPIASVVGDKQIKEILDLADKEMEPAAESVKIDKDNLPDGLEVVILGCQKS